jgi:hypothetical protein
MGWLIHRKFQVFRKKASNAAQHAVSGLLALDQHKQVIGMMGSALAKERSWTPNQLMRYGMVYLVSSMVTLFISMAYWRMTGFVK